MLKEAPNEDTYMFREEPMPNIFCRERSWPNCSNSLPGRRDRELPIRRGSPAWDIHLIGYYNALIFYNLNHGKGEIGESCRIKLDRGVKEFLHVLEIATRRFGQFHTINPVVVLDGAVTHT